MSPLSSLTQHITFKKKLYKFVFPILLLLGLVTSEMVFLWRDAPQLYIVSCQV